MTNRMSYVAQRTKTTGDVAVDGLLSGMAAGAVMAVALVVLGLVSGVGPGEMLGRFDPGGSGSPLVGGLMHLAISGIYGVAFALGLRLVTGRRPSLRRYGWLLGATYGLALWLAAHFVVLPGLDTALATIPPLHFIVAHLVYGGSLGYLVARHQS